MHYKEKVEREESLYGKFVYGLVCDKKKSKKNLEHWNIVLIFF